MLRSVLLASFLFGPVLCLLKFELSPFQIYMIAGCNGKHQIIHYILGSAELNDNVWTLLHHRSLNFRTAWEQTCELLSKHTLWYPNYKPENLRFVTGHCLQHLRKANLTVARSILGQSATRPVLDLRSFQKFCPFGHEDGFAEAQFREAAWGYGPAFPDGNWCASLRWLSHYPDDVWPLFDIECIDAMDQRRRFKVPVIDLVSDYDTWSIRGENSDYLQASIRYLNFANLRLDLRTRPWLPRWTKLATLSQERAEARMPFLSTSNDPWQDVFASMVDGSWHIKILREKVIPMLRKSNLSRSFQNRAILMYMAQCWCQRDTLQKNRSYLQLLFTGLLMDIDTNPIYLAKFLEQIVEFSTPYEVHDILKISYLNIKPITSHVHYTLWEILLRQKRVPDRNSEFLKLIPTNIRQDVALKSLRYTESVMKPIFWARAPLYRPQDRYPSFWSKDVDFIPNLLSQSNHKSIGPMIGFLGRDKLPKIHFGFGYADPLYSQTEFLPPKSRGEACHVLNAILRHTLNDLDIRGGQFGYKYCFASSNNFSGELCIEQLMDLFMLMFTWGCRVPDELLPSDLELLERFSKWDKVKLTENWMNISQFRKHIVEDNSSSSTST